MQEIQTEALCIGGPKDHEVIGIGISPLSNLRVLSKKEVEMRVDYYIPPSWLKRLWNWVVGKREKYNLPLAGIDVGCYTLEFFMFLNLMQRVAFYVWQDKDPKSKEVFDVVTAYLLEKGLL